MLTVMEAANKAGVSRRAIYYAIQDGRLKASMFGKSWAIQEKDLEETIQKGIHGKSGRPRKWMKVPYQGA